MAHNSSKSKGKSMNLNIMPNDYIACVHHDDEPCSFLTERIANIKLSNNYSCDNHTKINGNITTKCVRKMFGKNTAYCHLYSVATNRERIHAIIEVDLTNGTYMKLSQGSLQWKNVKGFL